MFPGDTNSETVQDSRGNHRTLFLRSVIPWIVVVLLAITLPYLFAWWRTPEGSWFTGALLNPDDLGVYISAMRQGASGDWLYNFVYSPEPWQPRLMLTLYLVLGKVTSLFAAPNVLWLHLWRVVLALATLSALAFWVRTLLPDRPRWQWTAWLLILFGGGISWLIAFVIPSATNLMPDIGMAEWSPLIALFYTPHFALGLGLEVIVFTCVVGMCEVTSAGEGIRWAVFGAIAAILAVLVYVYSLVIIALVIGLYMAIWALKLGRIPWRQWLLSSIIILPLIPFFYYYAFWTNNDPFWETYIRLSHVINPPPPLGALIGLGALLLLAIAGINWWLRMGRTLLLPVWAIVHLLIIYVPFISYSGRFSLGLMVPIATLAAVGLEAMVLPALTRTRTFPWFARITPTPFATLRRVCLFLLVPSSVIAILLFFKGPFINASFPYYLPKADVEAATWLGERSDESALTFAYYPMGNFLPRVYQGKVFLGQLDFTHELNKKLALYEHFWDSDQTQANRSAFLDEWGITHIFAGTYEASFQEGPFSLPGEAVYERDGITIFEVSSRR